MVSSVPIPNESYCKPFGFHIPTLFSSVTSLLGALDSLTAMRHFLILIISFLTSLLLPPHFLFNVNIVQCSLLTLVQLHICQLAWWPRQNSLYCFNLIRSQRIREIHCEVDIQLPFHEWPLVHRHTLIVDCLKWICMLHKQISVTQWHQAENWLEL